MRFTFWNSLVLLFLFTSWAVAAGKIVMVGAAVPLGAEDQMIAEHLEKLEFEVEPHAHDETHPVDLAGVDGVFITESTSSSNITSAYKDATVPVINAETYTYDDMSFAPDGSFNSDPDDTIVIVDSDHPITQGFKGEVKIHETPQNVMSCSDMQGDVHILATVAGNGNVAISFYEKGAKLIDGTALARRVNIFPHTTAITSLTDDAWTLIERSVLFGLGLITPVSPKGALAVTWGTLKADYR